MQYLVDAYCRILLRNLKHLAKQQDFKTVEGIFCLVDNSAEGWPEMSHDCRRQSSRNSA